MPYIKIVIIGQSSVGKTCIAVRACGGDFNESTAPTIGAASLCFKIKNSQGKEFETSIWDTAGQEKYRSLTPMYFNGASVVIYVYDITNELTLKALTEWDTLLEEKSPEDVVKVVVANKIDLNDQRKVSKSSGQEFMKEIGAARFFEVSAKTGEGIKEMFQEIVDIPEIPIIETDEDLLQEKMGSKSGTCC